MVGKNETKAQSSARRRGEMVERQIRARGVRAPAVLRAMRAVRREEFLPEHLAEFAYDDTPLPIGEEQTISQPYMVAFMIEALGLRGGERVLEVGTGSGYAAAVLAEIAAEVWTIERHGALAETARARLARSHPNVYVVEGDGTRGWPERAPFDAIVVAAGGPKVPAALRLQLAIGGRLVIPVGGEYGDQQLFRVTRRGERDFVEERLGAVRFVPLVGDDGWRPRPPETAPRQVAASAPPRVEAPAPRHGDDVATIGRAAEPFADLEAADLAPLLARIGDARVVLLGESTHGTSEFYRMRARITRALIEQRGFTIVTLEADWPDAAIVDHHVRGRAEARPKRRAFSRFPTWMWRNSETADFVDWLRQWNERLAPARRVRLAGLDLYALHHSIDVVLQYLDRVDPESAVAARQRYGCLTPWQRDPAEYGRAVLTRGYRSCESQVIGQLDELLQRRIATGREDDEALFEALQNARLVAGAESYYRAMFYGAREAWNLRDRHMCDCLRELLAFHGDGAKAVVWAHNSHVGDARATEMAASGEWNLGQLCREELGRDDVYTIGFGTDHGTVAAASEWGGPVEIKQVRPALDGSYERLCHDTGLAGFLLPLRGDTAAVRVLSTPRLERAIGVIYRPETERASHWFQAELPRQFDEYVWFDRSVAVQPLPVHASGSTSTDDTKADADAPDTWPFGL